MSWVALEDAIGIIQSSIANPEWNGPINAVAPKPVRNAEFAEMVGRILHRPARLSAPAFLLRLALGEMADALLLSSQRAIPERLLQSGYSFRFADLEAALRMMLRAN
jgi:NAD dependent epimerase/dehydratase family enzyme